MNRPPKSFSSLRTDQRRKIDATSAGYMAAIDFIFKTWWVGDVSSDKALKVINKKTNEYFKLRKKIETSKK